MADSAAQKETPFLLTVFLRHDQSKTLGEIGKHLEGTGFWKKFPPEGTEVVSWYVLMGIGQVVTLSVPPSRLREVNLAVEQSAWGASAPSSTPPTISARSSKPAGKRPGGGGHRWPPTSWSRSRTRSTGAASTPPFPRC